MNQYGLEFHHFGLATKRPARAETFLHGLGYTMGGEVFDPLQKVLLRLCTHDTMPNVELVSPGDEPGPLASILGNRQELTYHNCFETSNLDATLAALRDENRVVCVSEPKQAVLFQGRPVSFYLIHGFGLIELLEAPP